MAARRKRPGQRQFDGSSASGACPVPAAKRSRRGCLWRLDARGSSDGVLQR